MTCEGEKDRVWSNDQIELVHRIGQVCRRDWLFTDAELGLILPEQDMDRALTVLSDLTALLHDRGVLHHVCDGTLLGIIRENGFIPGDNDIDFRVDRKALTGDLETALTAQGFTVFKRSYIADKIANIGIARDGIAVDFYGTDFGPDTTRFELVFKRAFLSYREPFDGVRKQTFHGVQVFVPQEPKANLRFVYGDGWKGIPAKWDDQFSHGGLFRCTGRYRYLRRALLRFEAARDDAQNEGLHSGGLRRELTILKRVFAD